MLPLPIDRELADIAAAVYDVDRQTVGRWTRLADAAVSAIPAGPDPNSRADPTSGFKAAVFRNDEGTHALAFCGSELQARDWLTNLAQGLGMDTAQYRQATAFAKECKVQYGESLVLTGHSLGGGLAAIAAATTNTPCVTFNPAGVHRKTLERAGIDPEGFQRAAENGLIRKYVVKGEVLSRVNSLPLIPKAPGVEIVLQDPEKAWTVGKHSMAAVQRSLDAAGPHQSGGQPPGTRAKDPVASAMAHALRTAAPSQAVSQYPGLASAYQLLDVTRDKAKGLEMPARDAVVAAMREHLARRIEQGQQIPAPRQSSQAKVAERER